MPILGTIASSRQVAVLGGSWESIASTVVPTTGDVYFSNISSDYIHLQVRCLVRGSRANHADGLNIQLNGYGSTVYATGRLIADGTALLAQSEGNNVAFLNGVMVANSSASNWASSMIWTILDYKNIANKYVSGLSQGGYVSATTYATEFGVGNFNFGETVNAMRFYGSGGSILAGSIFALYGIKES